MARRLSALVVILGLCFWNGSAVAGESAGIYILSAVYGRSGGRVMDIGARLQDLCGTRGNSCDVWCAQSTFGGRKPGRHALCRVIYRCDDGATRSVEAAIDEPILMRCLARPEAG